MSKATPFSRWVELTGSEREPARGATIGEPTLASESFEVSVKVRRRTPLPRMTPGPHRHMTHAEYAANHGADPDDIKKVEAFARHFHLNVQAVLPAERTVLLGGTAANFSKAFGVELRTHHLANGQTYRGRVGKISMPSELEGAVVGVFGLDNRRVAWPNVRFTQSTTGQAARKVKGLVGGTVSDSRSDPGVLCQPACEVIQLSHGGRWDRANHRHCGTRRGVSPAGP